MQALRQLSAPALTTFVLATSVQSPAAAVAPIFWEYFSDLIASEVAFRQGISCPEPAVPIMTAAELEMASTAMAAVASQVDQSAEPDPEAAKEIYAFAMELAEGLLAMRRDVEIEPGETIH